MPSFIRGLTVIAVGLMLAACATNVAQEKATRFDQGVAAYDAGDFAQAYAIWSKLAGEDDLAAMRNTANLLRQGKGVAKDERAAFKLYEEAAEKGLVTAMANIAEMYMAGEGVERDAKKAAEWYARAAIAGLSLAQVRLADMYEHGVGVEKDHKRALALLERAARNGYGPAQQKLKEMGVHLPAEGSAEAAPLADPWRGDGAPPAAAADVPRSDAPAGAPPPTEHARRPQPGDPLTQDTLASLSANDANVMQQGLTAYQAGNKAAAFAAWRQEADKGVGEAQTRVALLYARGEGTKQDAIEAYRWLRLAAAQGNQGAWVELPVVAAQLSPAERAMGESLVRMPNGAQNKSP
jgi:TPR repeat protein